MKSYNALLQKILKHGDERMDRTGVGTKALFGEKLVFDTTVGFPAVTTKKLFFKSVAAELAGFLEGTESAARMRELGTKIWDANANADWWQLKVADPDYMGKVYGSQWRNFGGSGIDQLRDVVDRIKSDPTDRRLVVTAWNPADLDDMCLPPCHIFFQFFVREEHYLDIQWYIRSVDSFLGMPFDIASYALLQHIVAQEAGLFPGYNTMISGDTHIYNNHVDQVVEQIGRKPFPLPELALHPEATIDNFEPGMVELIGYQSHESIKAEMAV